jgi:hypothetical protein
VTSPKGLSDSVSITSIGVGTAHHRPSLRTVQADLPHTALRSAVLPHEDWKKLDKHTKGTSANLPEGSESMSTNVLGQSIPWLPSLSIKELPVCAFFMWRGSESDSHLLSPDGHSRGWKPRAHASRTSAFLHPFAPRALPRFFATMGALTPAQGVLRARHTRIEHPPWPGQDSLVNMARTSLHSVTNHPTHPVIASPLPSQRDSLPEPGLRPASSLPCRGLANLWQTSCFHPCPGLGFAINEQARRNARPKRVRFTTDCKFASGCSPPRLAATQLPSALGSGHLPREDFHLSDRACSQAHSFRLSPERQSGLRGGRITQSR